MEQTFTLTFGDRAENHKGMQLLGEFAPNGFGIEELEEMAERFKEKGLQPTIYDLRLLLDAEFDEAAPAYLLVVPDGVSALIDKRKLWEEQVGLEKDTKAFMYGRVVNKHARHNLCFSHEAQEPDYENGKGRVVPFSSVPVLSELRDRLPELLGEKARELLVEGNYYFDLKKCGIGFHGDAERRRVVGVRLGAPLPFHYQWFRKSKPVGERGELIFEDGDLYVMSEKAVGTDWMSKNILTLRHAAGAEKFLKIGK